MSKILVKFYWDCGRNGDVEGLFITTKKELKYAIGKQIYFGEILGKHSEVYGILKKNEVKIISEDVEKINWLEDIQGINISGYNPLNYIE